MGEGGISSDTFLSVGILHQHDFEARKRVTEREFGLSSDASSSVGILHQHDMEARKREGMGERK